MELKHIEDDILDIPSNQDYMFEEYLQEEQGEGIQTVWPTDYYKVLNQGQTPMCSLYSIIGIINSNNILEDFIQEGQLVRDQIDPKIYGIDKVRSMQVRLDWAKKEGLIAGYLSIPKVGVKTPTGIMTKERRLKEIKSAFDKGLFVYTGTDRTNRTMEQSPILKLGTDTKQGHIFGLTGYGYSYHSTGDLIRQINSFGEKRGDYGYGYIKEEEIDRLYTCYVIIPKTNKEFFDRYKKNKKRNEWINQGKEFYQEDVKDGNIESIKYFNDIKLSKTLTKLWKL